LGYVGGEKSVVTGKAKWGRSRKVNDDEVIPQKHVVAETGNLKGKLSTPGGRGTGALSNGRIRRGRKRKGFAVYKIAIK